MYIWKIFKFLLEVAVIFCLLRFIPDTKLTTNDLFLITLTVIIVHLMLDFMCDQSKLKIEVAPTAAPTPSCKCDAPVSKPVIEKFDGPIPTAKDIRDQEKIMKEQQAFTAKLLGTPPKVPVPVKSAEKSLPPENNNPMSLDPRPGDPTYFGTN